MATQSQNGQPANYNATSPTLTDGDASSLAVDSSQNLKVTDVRGSFDHGRKSSISTSAVQITATSTTARNGVLVKASNSNTGTVYVGNSDVTAAAADATSGYELGAGESVVVPVDNANKVYVIGSAASQTVFFIVI